MKKIAIIILGLLFAFPSSGTVIFAYFNSVKTEDNLYFYGDMILDWDLSEQTKNPCYLYHSCSLTMGLYTEAGFRYLVSYPITTSHRPCLTTAKTYGELGQCLEGYTTQAGLAIDTFTFSNPTHINVGLTTDGNSVGCVKIKMSGAKGWGSEDLGIIPTVCGMAPPPMGACSTPDFIDFDHGTVNNNYSNGNILTDSFNIECNQTLTAKLSLNRLTDGKLKLTDGLNSALKINGYNADNTPSFDLKAGSNVFNITSELIKSGTVTPGDYQAQTIMMLALE